MGLVEHTGELLYNLALAIYDGLSPEQQGKLGEPDEESFATRNPYTAFDRFIKQVDRVRSGWRFIITIDEFELIEQLIDTQRLESKLLDFWRGLIQTYPWFIMAFAGLHTLQEMTQDYWNPLFGSVTRIPVSFLSPGAARQLITQPSPDFNIDYDLPAVEQIIALTNGQPYLLSPEQLSSILAIAPEQIHAALHTLQQHDVIVERDATFVYTVELMQRWIMRRSQRQPSALR